MTDRITDEELERVEKACDGATPEPWDGISDDDGFQIVKAYIGTIAELYPASMEHEDPKRFKGDCTFILTARVWLPRMAAEVRRLRAESAAMELSPCQLDEIARLRKEAAEHKVDELDRLEGLM